MSRVDQIVVEGRRLIDELAGVRLVMSPAWEQVGTRFIRWHLANRAAIANAWSALLPELAAMADGIAPADHQARFIAIGLIQSMVKKWFLAFAGNTIWAKPARVGLRFTGSPEWYWQAEPGETLPAPGAMRVTAAGVPRPMPRRV